MEPITIYRGPATTDADGNARRGTPVAVGSFLALVAEEHHVEARGADSDAVLVACKVYVREQGPTGVLATDLVEVRGQRLPVDGLPQLWRRPTGEHIGDVITLRRKDG